LDDWVRLTKWAVLRWIYRREIAAVETAFSVEPFDRILAAYPDIAVKPVRGYLMNGLRRQHRSTAVIGHYVAAARILTSKAFVESHTSGVQLAALSTPAGEITVDLEGQGGLYREAEWRLVLRDDGHPVIEMGLAIVDRQVLRLAGIGKILWIGALKTAFAGEHGLDESRTLTKAMEGLRPKALLLISAQTLAGAFGLEGIFAASNKGHVFAGDYSLRRRIKADYDRFWLESGGERVNLAIFALPATKTQRGLSEYKPNKRAQARRRQALEREIEDQIRDSVTAFLRPRLAE
jgi:uncharacterized protein VirK/YbjX